LPRGLAASLSRGPLTAVLVHELAHIKRRDLVWDWIPTLARVLYAFHPVAHSIAFRARLERELACDQAAMLITGQDAARYASTLVDVVTRSSEPPAIRSASSRTGPDELAIHTPLSS
jgi:beta-lactamase regulating signal transducer with metallopeptidase domain